MRSREGAQERELKKGIEPRVREYWPLASARRGWASPRRGRRGLQRRRKRTQMRWKTKEGQNGEREHTSPKALHEISSPRQSGEGAERDPLSAHSQAEQMRRSTPWKELKGSISQGKKKETNEEGWF